LQYTKLSKVNKENTQSFNSFGYYCPAIKMPKKIVYRLEIALVLSSIEISKEQLFTFTNQTGARYLNILGNSFVANKVKS
jgi:hypothetical protein